MSSHPEHDDEGEPDRGTGNLLTGVIVVAVIVVIVVLHLTGVVGPSTH